MSTVTRQRSSFSTMLISDRSMVSRVSIFWRWEHKVVRTACRWVICMSRSAIFSSRRHFKPLAERFFMKSCISWIETSSSRSSRIVSRTGL